jgi:hypothetical protein
LPPPTVAQRNRDGPLGIILTDDIPVKFRDNLTRREGGHVGLSGAMNFRGSYASGNCTQMGDVVATVNPSKWLRMVTATVKHSGTLQPPAHQFPAHQFIVTLGRAIGQARGIPSSVKTP